MDKKYLSFLGVGAVVIVILAVVFMTKSGRNNTSETTPAKATYDTVYPLPSSVQGFMKVSGDEAINFQTTLTIKDSEVFYRTELTKMNLKERTIDTSATETTFSMVFDGYKDGKSVVVQGVGISGKTNINIRLEKL